ncbi:MAG: hypothetical protein GYB66_15020 [Chloroflexi bacterium]|nr:hypothetical protein [Chloroflexota bacterium]
MNHRLSRRRFLQFAGIALAANSIDWLFPSGLSAMFSARGRALHKVPMHARPEAQAPQVDSLWPDSVHELKWYDGQWLRVANGYARQTSFQPLLNLQPPASFGFSELPGWVEVIAPIVAIRQYCAPYAPIWGRIGHGALLWIERSLRVDGGMLWLKSAAGWLPAVHVRPVEIAPPQRQAGFAEIFVDKRHNRLLAIQDGKTVFELACRLPNTLPTVATVTSQHPASVRRDGGSIYPGAPWYIELGPGSGAISGVYWHHEVGPGAGVATSGDIELPVIGARVLYRWTQAFGLVKLRLI